MLQIVFEHFLEPLIQEMLVMVQVRIPFFFFFFFFLVWQLNSYSIFSDSIETAQEEIKFFFPDFKTKEE